MSIGDEIIEDPSKGISYSRENPIAINGKKIRTASMRIKVPRPSFAIMRSRTPSAIGSNLGATFESKFISPISLQRIAS